MQANLQFVRDTIQEIRVSTQEISANKFASLCTEAHAVTRGKLAKYLHDMVEAGQGALFAAYNPEGNRVGRVCVEVHQGYVTRGKPCATFGWLDGTSPGVVHMLLDQAAAWASTREILVDGSPRRNTLLRGPISFPKNLGGFGCQVEGFSLPRIYCVPTNQPDLAGWIAAAGFKQDASYACVDVTDTPTWNSAPGELDGFTLVSLTADQWREREGELVGLAGAAFADFLPDIASGRFEEMWGATASVSKTFYSWPAALDREGKVAGFITALPNLWEAWDGRKVTCLNVDTVVIAPKYRGCGIFSAIHNKGVTDTRAHLGIRYYEGTAIWMANENAVRTIFPHGKLVRKHVVFQRRLRK